MIYQITLKNIDLGQQLGSLKDQLEIMQNVIFKSPLFFAAKQADTLCLELYVQRLSNQSVMLVFNGLTLQNSADNPHNEIHAWLTKLFKSVNLPFAVTDIYGITGNAFKPDQSIFTQVSASTLNRSEKIYPTRAQPSVVPGFQILCIRDTAYSADTPIEAIAELFNNLLREYRMRLPIQVSRNGMQVDFSSIYLHSCTHKAVIFILPYYKPYRDDVINLPKEVIINLLTVANLPYQVASTFFKFLNCFSPPYSETKNSSWVDQLETDTPLENNLLCALSAQVMDNPIKMPGTDQVVERGAIELEIRLRGTNPYNRQPLTEDQLIPCPELMSQINDHVHSMIRSRIQRGAQRFKENKFEQAIYDFSSVLSYCSFHSVLRPQEHSLVLNNLACSYRNIMDYHMAIEYFQGLLLHDLKSHAPLKHKAKHLQKLADIYLKMRLPETAIKYFTSALTEFTRDHDDSSSEDINSALDECKKLSASIGGSFSREPKSLHSICLEKEAKFHSDYRNLAKTTTPPEGPFIIFANDYNDFDTKCFVVPFRYNLILDQTPGSLEKLHQKYAVKDMPDKILLAVIRDLQLPCLSASSYVEKNDQGLVIQFNLSVVLYLPSPPPLNLSEVSDAIFRSCDKIKFALMPQLGRHNVRTSDNGVFIPARTSMLFSQPTTKSVQSGNIEIAIYTFANCLKVDSPAEKRTLGNILKTFSCDLFVSTSFKDYADNELPKVLSCLDTHITDHGKTHNHPDRREILRELAHLYHDPVNTDKALDFYRQVLTIDRAILLEAGNSQTSHLLLACDLIQLGKLYQQQGNHSRAFNCFKDALTAYQQGEIEEPAAVTKLQEMITQYQSTAKQHASQAMIQFFKRPSTGDRATSGGGAASQATRLC